MHACVLRCFSRVQLFATLWTVAHQAPLSLEFSKQEYWSGLSFPLPGDLPNPGIKPMYPVFPELAGRFFTIEPTVYHKKISHGLIRRGHIWKFESSLQGSGGSLRLISGELDK